MVIFISGIVIDDIINIRIIICGIRRRIHIDHRLAISVSCIADFSKVIDRATKSSIEFKCDIHRGGTPNRDDQLRIIGGYTSTGQRPSWVIERQFRREVIHQFHT